MSKPIKILVYGLVAALTIKALAYLVGIIGSIIGFILIIWLTLAYIGSKEDK